MMTRAVALLLAVTFPAAAMEHEQRLSSADLRAHWAARSTLAHAVMFSGLGEPLAPSMGEMDAILQAAGYVMRPRMPEMALAGAVFAAAAPRPAGRSDYADPATLRWEPSGFDRNLEVEAQAWTLAKIASPGFHLTFHAEKAERRAALLMVPQAEALAAVLEERLLDRDGLFRARGVHGSVSPATPRAQITVLWGASTALLALTSDRDDYWHAGWRQLTRPDRFATLAAKALRAVEALPPTTPVDRALAIEALARHALARAAEGDELARLRAAIVAHAGALAGAAPQNSLDLSLTIYGLVEAAAFLRAPEYRKAAWTLYERDLDPLWDDSLPGYRDLERLDPFVAAGWLLGLQSVRLFASRPLAAEAAARHARLVTFITGAEGLMLASPLPVVAEPYLQQRPAADFADPELPMPEAAGLAPVLAGVLERRGEGWRRSTTRFATASSMWLANVLTVPFEGGADAFLPRHRLRSTSE